MSVNVDPLPPSALERLLARDRRLIAVALVTLVVLAWSYLLVLSKQMSADDSMASMPGMPAMPNMPGMGGTAGSGGEVTPVIRNRCDD